MRAFRWVCGLAHSRRTRACSSAGCALVLWSFLTSSCGWKTKREYSTEAADNCKLAEMFGAGLGRKSRATLRVLRS